MPVFQANSLETAMRPLDLFECGLGLHPVCVYSKLARTYSHPDGETDPRVSAELNHEIHVDKYTQDG